ncbi:hypothetical protein [Kitasatospora sp. NPDC001527]|uniref:hypothetical protein n=1 Tax=Kitasatospora sp. NPDC001527 TaxID=3154519 RepID=UPI00332F5821
MIFLDFSTESIKGFGYGGRGKGLDFRNADLYDLTYEAFWGDIEFRVGDADFSGPGPVLDMAIGLFSASLELAKKKSHLYSAAEGAGYYRFDRKGDDVRIRLERMGSGVVSYEEFSSAARGFLELVLKELPRKYPGLSENPEISKLKGRLKQ